MMKSRKTLVGLLVLLQVVLMLGLPTTANDFPFTDVLSSEWYYEDVRIAYERKLINGKTTTTFAPNDYLKYSEAVKLAACLHIDHVGGEALVMSKDCWYQVYVDYCYSKGIINKDYPWEEYATRGDYIEIFSKALPDSSIFSINKVDDGSIPDVPMSHKNADAIYKMYRAGVVRGVDDAFRCLPDDNVKRSEVAAVLTRMVHDVNRLLFSVTLDKDAADSDDNTPTTSEKEQEGNKDNTPQQGVVPTPLPVTPWENGGKKPELYTWEEYCALSAAQRAAFIDYFDTILDFQTWLIQAQKQEERLPWEDGGKQPKDYTLAEYEALSNEQKEAFIDTFESLEEFEAWMSELKGGVEAFPWDNGGKQPRDYTLAEYEALSETQKAAFVETFDSAENFQEWLNEAQTDSEKLPWENGGKKPENYTLAEYEALSDSQKEAFFEAFDTAEDFQEWLDSVKSDDEQLPWENGGKQPKDYTLAEYGALSDSQKEAFVESFGTVEDFQEWLNEAQVDSEQLPWETGGKQPKDYTFAEYEALSDSQKEAFASSFTTTSAFENWLNKAQGLDKADTLPWETGGKQPSEYTWAEYSALSDTQKEAFFESFATTSAFENWLNKAQGLDKADTLPWENGGKQPSDKIIRFFHFVAPFP